MPQNYKHLDETIKQKQRRGWKFIMQRLGCGVQTPESKKGHKVERVSCGFKDQSWGKVLGVTTDKEQIREKEKGVLWDLHSHWLPSKMCSQIQRKGETLTGCTFKLPATETWHASSKPVVSLHTWQGEQRVQSSEQLQVKNARSPRSGGPSKTATGCPEHMMHIHVLQWRWSSHLLFQRISGTGLGPALS